MRAVRRGLIATAALLGGALALSPAASAAPRFCGPSERPCTKVTVPLDRTGAVPGQIDLQVERRRARRPTRAPLLLLAGGPGQSGTAAFSSEAVADVLGRESRQRDILVLDQRGTGLSGAISCPLLQRSPFLGAGRAVERCEAGLGARRGFYQTRDSVQDIEAVRSELGVPKLALMGTSYGTKVALQYAAAYPDRVDRLVLDSVVPANGPSPFGLEALRAAPRLLTSQCGRLCRSFTRDPVADLRVLSRRLARAPLRGVVVDDRGRKRPAKLDLPGLLTLLVAGDFNPALRQGLPGAVRAARDGDRTPLLRLASLASQQETEVASARELSVGLYAATVCEEVAFPWTAATPIPARAALARRALAAAPARAFRAFDRATALRYDYVDMCRRWRGSGRPRPPAVPTRLPGVPTLLLAGARDARTPVASARSVARRIPGSHLLVATRSGHDVIGQDADGCATRALQRFLAGRRPARRCSDGPKALVVPPPPRSITKVRRIPGLSPGTGRTISALRYTVRQTKRELGGQLLVFLILAFGGEDPPDELRVGGLRGGRADLQLENGRLRFERLIAVPGVRVSGSIAYGSSGRPRGRLRITGRAAASGTLTVRNKVARGRLGGRPVRFAVDLDLFKALADQLESLFGGATAARFRP